MSEETETPNSSDVAGRLDGPVRCSDLSGHRKLFGWRFFDERAGETTIPLVTVYVEDDEWWHPKMTFNRYWIEDFLRNAEDMWSAPNAKVSRAHDKA